MQAITASGAGGVSSSTALDQTYRKIMWRIMPVVMVLWLVAFLDRQNIGFATLTMSKDLDLTAAAFGLAGGMFFLGYVFWEIPSNLALTRFGARKTITRIAVLWGISNAAMMFTNSAFMLYVLRFLLGSFEAGLFPGVLLYMTFWMPAERRSAMVGWFASMGAVAGIIGGPLAGYILTGMAGLGGYAGWQWLFLVEGLLSVVVGVVSWFFIHDLPETAPWLSSGEKTALAADLARDSEVMSHRKESFWPTLVSPIIWILVLGQVANNYCYTGLTIWGPTMMKDAGLTDPRTIGWIVSGISLVTFVGMVAIGYSSNRFNDTKFHFGVAALLSALGMVVVATGASSTNLVVLGLLWAQTFSGCAIAAFWAIPSRVFARMALIVGLAFISAMGNIGGFFGSSVLGVIRDMSGSYSGGFYVMAAIYVVAGLLVAAVIVDRATAKTKAFS